MWGCWRHLWEREADTTVVTFEFDYLLDPIGPDQAPGASRFAPADAMTPTPAGSNRRPTDRVTSPDADAWLLELLTQPSPPAFPAADEDMTWLDEACGVATTVATTTTTDPSALPMPVLATRVDLPPPAALTAFAGSAPIGPTRAQDPTHSRFATASADDDRLPIRRHRRRRRPR